MNWKQRFEEEQAKRKALEKQIERTSQIVSPAERMPEAVLQSQEDQKVFLVLDQAGYIVQSNKFLAELLEESAESLKGKSIYQFLSESRGLELTGFMKEAFADGPTDQGAIVFPLVTSSEGLTWLELRLVYDPAIDTDAEVRRFLINDVSESVTAFNQFRSLVFNLNEAVLLESPDRTIRAVNQSFCNLFSIPVSPENLIGSDCSDSAEQSKHLFKDEEAFVKGIERLLRHQKEEKGELLELKDGRMLKRDYIPIFVEGVYDGHLWTYNDITVSYRHLELIKVREEKYHNIIANMNLGLMEVDKHDKVEFVNPTFEKLSGYSASELVGKKASSIFLDAAALTLLDEKNKMRAFGQSDAYEIPVTLRTGEQKWWLVSGAPNRDVHGKITGSIGIHLDITKQKNLEAQLRKKNDELQLNIDQQRLLANAAHMLVSQSVSFEQRVQDALSLVGEFLEVSRVYIFEDNADRSATSNTFEWCANGIEPQIEELQDVPYEVITYWKETLDDTGLIFTTDIGTLPQEVRDILEPQGIKSLLVCALEDMEEVFGFIGFDECFSNRVWPESNIQLLKTFASILSNAFQQRNHQIALVESEKNALAASKSKDTFLAVMSHEIRTPLNGVIGLSKELLKTSLSAHQIELLETVCHAADGLKVIIDDILDLSKITAGKLELEEKPFRIMRVIQKGVQLHRGHAEEKGLQISVTVEPAFSEAVYLGDATRVSEVLHNLLSNAVKFSDSGRILVSCRILNHTHDTHWVELAVQDHGIGIDAEYLAHIFDRFSQEDDSIARRFGGTGLGMSIIKGLVDLMGGQLSVESEKHVGTKVVCQLPFKLSKAVDEKAQDSALPVLDFDLSDKSILLAEDNEMNQMLIEVMLKPTGVKLLLAETGREAVDMVRKHKVDLVLMDIQMPEMDGIEATKIIRQDLEMSVPIVALTAKSFKGSEQEYKQKGMNDFIPKPIDEHRFSETLARLLDIEYMNGTELDEPAQVSRKQKLDYSLDRIERGCNYNRTTVVRILGKFIEQGSQTTLEIREALAEKDLKRIRNLSHRIKSSLDTMDVHYLSRLANEIERMESLKSQINRSKIIEFCQGVDDLISLLRNESIDSNDAEI